MKSLFVGAVSEKSCGAKRYASGLPYSRFAVVVPNRECASVVARNRFRRTVYETIREKKLYDSPDRDVVLFFRGIKNLSNENIAEIVIKIIRRI